MKTLALIIFLFLIGNVVTWSIIGYFWFGKIFRGFKEVSLIFKILISLIFSFIVTTIFILGVRSFLF